MFLSTNNAKDKVKKVHPKAYIESEYTTDSYNYAHLGRHLQYMICKGGDNDGVRDIIGGGKSIDGAWEDALEKLN